MNMLTRYNFIVVTSLLSHLSLANAQQEAPFELTNSKEFTSSKASATKILEGKLFHEDLMGIRGNAVAIDEYPIMKKKIESTWKTLNPQTGSSNVTYDIILQAGHYGRASGNTGTTGPGGTEERQLVAYLVRKVAEELRKTTKLTVLVLSADDYSPGLKGRIFLSIHAEGSKHECKSGPSLSYQKNSSTLAMHAIGWGVTRAMDYEHKEFRPDNYTANAGKYYMFSKVDAPVMKGLLEVGELTCASREKELVSSADRIAYNVARAIDFVMVASEAPIASK